MVYIWPVGRRRYPGFRPCMFLNWMMIDKAMSVKHDKLGPSFGRLDDESMLSVVRSLAVFVAIA